MKEHKHDIFFSILLVLTSGAVFFTLGLLAASRWGMVPSSTAISNVSFLESVTTSATEEVADNRIDLNSATIEDLIKIDGIGEKTAEKIIRYRDELGGFQFVEQLLDMDGVGDKKFAAWSPYLKVVLPEESTTGLTEETVSTMMDGNASSDVKSTSTLKATKKTAATNNGKGSVSASASVSLSTTVSSIPERDSTTAKSVTTASKGTSTATFEPPFDLNTVTKEALMSISGIGEKTADKIIAYRNEIGEFTSLEQLKDIKGIGDATYAKMIEFLFLDNVVSNVPETKPTVSDKLNLNTATMDDLMQIKGIGEKTAQKIIDYRNEHGAFTSLEQLMEIKGIGQKTYENLCQFLTVDES